VPALVASPGAPSDYYPGAMEREYPCPICDRAMMTAVGMIGFDAEAGLYDVLKTCGIHSDSKAWGLGIDRSYVPLVDVVGQNE
jgi:hypothetical protein